MTKNGWYRMCGWDLYLVNGEVVRGISDGVTVYPYKRTGADVWTIASGVKESTLRQGLRRGNYILA